MRACFEHVCISHFVLTVYFYMCFLLFSCSPFLFFFFYPLKPSFAHLQIVWFIAPAILGTFLYSRRLAIALAFIFTNQSLPPLFPLMGCAEEFLWDVFGGVSACVLVESILKAIFGRNRPEYTEVKQNFTMEVPTVPFEEHSLPSGHSMRAFYLCYWMSMSPYVGSGDFSLQVTQPFVAFPWAAMVAWSRVAKGRHYPLDVAVGAVFGALLGMLVEGVFTFEQKACIKMAGGFFITFFVRCMRTGEGRRVRGGEASRFISRNTHPLHPFFPHFQLTHSSLSSLSSLSFFSGQFGVNLIIPTVRQSSPDSKVGVYYFLFYVGLLLATLPGDRPLGRQTLVEGTDGNYVCGTSWWGGGFE